MKTLDELWKRLSAHQAFTVPHHTGVNWAAASWEKKSPLRPLIEIFSVHGQSERFDPQNPLSYDRMIGMPPYGSYPQGSLITPEEFRDIVPLTHSANGPHYAQDAWAADLELGTIASSDDYTARPGSPYWGLAAVWVEHLDRRSIFQALLYKRTYATTGQRIYLDFRVNNALPGTHVASDGPPRITLEVCGTNMLETVEILKFQPQSRTYSIVRVLASKTSYLKDSIVDKDFSDCTFYYVRLKQHGLVDGRPVMAWSSPIWVDRKH